MAEEEIPEELLLTIKEAFQLYSGSSAGDNAARLKEAFSQNLEKKLGEKEENEVITTLVKGEDATKQINYEAFLAAVVRGLKLKRLNDVFRSYDLDNDGFITKDEIKKGMRRYNQTISSEEAEQIIINMGDIDRDGKINFFEFSSGYL